MVKGKTSFATTFRKTRALGTTSKRHCIKLYENFYNLLSKDNYKVTKRNAAKFYF